MSDSNRPAPPIAPATRDPVALRGRVAKLKREGRLDEAIALVTEQVESEGAASMDTLVWRAQLLALAGRHPEALADLDAASERPGRSQIEAYDLRLRCLRALGRDDLADAFAASTPRPAMPSASAQAAFGRWFEGAITGKPVAEMLYEVGHAYGPGGAIGRDTLRLVGDDGFELDNDRGGEKRRWTGRLRSGGYAELEKLVAASGFPELPARPPVAGSAIRQLRIGGHMTMVPFHDTDSVRGYRVLFEAIDGLIDDIKRGRTGGRVAELHGPPPER
jgi:hypothetical protein